MAEFEIDGLQSILDLDTATIITDGSYFVFNDGTKPYKVSGPQLVRYVLQNNVIKTADLTSQMDGSRTSFSLPSDVGALYDLYYNGQYVAKKYYTINNSTLFFIDGYAPKSSTSSASQSLILKYATLGPEANSATIDHRYLQNLSAQDQHPIEAITGLREALQNQATGDSSFIRSIWFAKTKSDTVVPSPNDIGRYDYNYVDFSSTTPDNPNALFYIPNDVRNGWTLDKTYNLVTGNYFEVTKYFFDLEEGQIPGIAKFSTDGGMGYTPRWNGNIGTGPRNPYKVYYSLSSKEEDNPGSMPGWTGELVLQASTKYEDFIYNLKNNSELLISEQDYQNSITENGNCPKFVYNEIEDTLRLPLISGYIGTSSNGIESVKAGLPNITGTFTCGSGAISDPQASGAISGTTNNSGRAAGDNGLSQMNVDNFNASLSNSIYGASDTVQPAGVKLWPWIVLATEQIIRSTEIVDEGPIWNAISSINSVLSSLGGTFPSDRTQRFNLLPTGSTYTAPADGWFTSAFSATGAQIGTFTNTANYMSNSGGTAGAYNAIGASIPVKKGAVVRYDYNHPPNLGIYFVYAEKQNPEQKVITVEEMYALMDPNSYEIVDGKITPKRGGSL